MPEWITALCTFGALVIAWCAFNSWKSQHSAKENEKLAVEIRTTVYWLQFHLYNAMESNFQNSNIDGWLKLIGEWMPKLYYQVRVSKIYWGDVLAGPEAKFTSASGKVLTAIEHRKHNIESNNIDVQFNEDDRRNLYAGHTRCDIDIAVESFDKLLANKQIR